MPQDKKLREVLDTLSGDAARSLPAQDRELMESVLRRLKIQENRRLADEEPVRGPEPEEGPASEELRRLQDERERLLAHQHELEDRLARLEAASHGGPLSYVDEGDDSPVEFSRVDLSQTDDDLLEFQYLGPDDTGFQQPQKDVWEDEPQLHPEAEWESWPHNQAPHEPNVAWDDEPPEPWPDEDDATAAASWDEPQQAERRDPAEAWDDQGGDETPPWSESAQQEPWPEHDEEVPPHAAHKEAPPSPADPMDGLDEQTRGELEELEAQLAELEREIERRGGEGPEAEEENA